MTGLKLFGIYGAGGFGRELMPVLMQSACAQMPADQEWRAVFIDDGADQTHPNYDVLTLDQFAQADAGSKEAVLAVGSGAARRAMAARCQSVGVPLSQLIASNAVTLDNVQLGEGAVLAPFAMVTSDAIIGRLFQANFYAYVAHDCIVGDAVTLAPGAKVNGNVEIGDDVTIGSGAVLRNGQAGRRLKIGAGAVIGMGAVVTKDVAPGVTVAGNPARPLVK